MAETIRRPDPAEDPDPSQSSGTARSSPSGRILRFDRVERAVHWVNATLFAILIVTGCTLYLSSLMRVVGHRQIVELTHLASGLALPVPILIAVIGRWGRGLRADLRRFNRWTTEDRTWLRVTLHAREERAVARAALLDGKFNAGQKLNAAFTAGAGLALLGTGVIMYWFHPWPLAWRTGATYVHDWLALAIMVAVLGHISFALRDPDSLSSMRRGTISRTWARQHARGWLGEVE